MISVEEDFKNLISKYTNNKDIIHSYWVELKMEYDSKTRHYHNLSHITELLQHFNQYQDKIMKKDIVLFAIFYHDIIYDVKKKDNEEKSAKLARRKMRELNIQTEKINLCYNFIIATKSHETDFTDPDLAYFLDFDLAVLGKDRNNYLKYTKKIRKEYSIYPEVLYRKGRIKALNSILENDRIYKTEDFFRKLEKQARKNIEKEIKELLLLFGNYEKTTMH